MQSVFLPNDTAVLLLALVRWAVICGFSIIIITAWLPGRRFGKGFQCTGIPKDLMIISRELRN